MAPRIQKILFASDLTENSRYAFEFASSLSSRYDAGLVLVHVIEELHTGINYRIDSVLGEGSAKRLVDYHKEKAMDALIGKKKTDHEVRSGLAAYYGEPDKAQEASFEVVISEGDVDDEVERIAKEKGCDLIVIGSHKGLIGGTSLSGITKSVLRHSRVPVLVVPPPAKKA